eukprot:TRINITY_DN15988_c0_g1_i3.p1 TRINITY_DN15988_c0_g1~~TRINITY_DN15988_c0_g1_i3.p1  ORF type:complete len:291 (-),score=47.85 TRINITY_DN15988_c0_g1_i3:78-869(-)
MEFPFDMASCVGAPNGHEGPCVGLIDERVLRSRVGGALSTVLEEMGLRSMNAQGLRKPVTYGVGLGDHRVYLLVDGRSCLGFLKVGVKRLFVEAPPCCASAPSRRGNNGELADVQGTFREIEPLCQRSGFGWQLFETMLSREQVPPEQMAFDRPSPKLISFLKKHYGLSKFRPQNNNFVVFDLYFDPAAEDDSRTRRGRHDARTESQQQPVAASRSPASCRQLADRPGNSSSRRSMESTARAGYRDLFGGPGLNHRRAAAPIF